MRILTSLLSLLCRGCGMGSGDAHLWHRTVDSSCSLFFFILMTSPPLGVGGDLGSGATLTWEQDCGPSIVLFCRDLFSPPPPLLGVCRYFGFASFRRHILARPPLVGGMMVIFDDIFPSLRSCLNSVRPCRTGRNGTRLFMAVRFHS